MSEAAGVYVTKRKDGSTYYRAGITVNGKHISLGSYDDIDTAAAVYAEAGHVMACSCSIDDYSKQNLHIPFRKYVVLVNYRDNKMYFKTPVYLSRNYFTYYIEETDPLKFSVDDLFYYTTHSIMRRGGHLFVADYGMQVNIMSRYGIREHAVCGRDYYFANGDRTDYRYGNIVIINPYHGVFHYVKNGRDYYKVKIHINGDYVVGTYHSAAEAAIAYNKAADILHDAGCKINFPENYPENISAISYASIYNSIRISQKIREYRF